jgi:hypothetical protein
MTMTLPNPRSRTSNRLAIVAVVLLVTAVVVFWGLVQAHPRGTPPAKLVQAPAGQTQPYDWQLLHGIRHYGHQDVAAPGSKVGPIGDPGAPGRAKRNPHGVRPAR